MTLPAALLLWTCVWGAVAPRSGGANGTGVERRWETLFSRSYLGLAGRGPLQPDWQSDYLRGVKRVRRLYCNVGIGFHLQVLPDGRIAGAHLEDPHSELTSAPPASKGFARARARARSRCTCHSS